MKLHYSQTEEELRPFLFEFQYLMKLHYSQTAKWDEIVIFQFQYLMKLHYSQTNCILGHLRKSFSTL